MVDLFATRDNHKLPLYVSPINYPAAWAVDARSFAWDQLGTCSYLSPIIIPQIFEKSGWTLARFSLVAKEILVQRPSQSPGRLYRKLHHRSDLLFYRDRLHADPDMFHYTSGRYLTSLRKKRFFSVRASTLVASAMRKSTRTVYELSGSSSLWVFEGILIAQSLC
ncbi:hypothetical protein DPMN_175100 [Dreissena polymorpha]|uniref:Uncharacterized protein n=1 Tax=Dreissena polymorpha TaxID=45954 RepID=A0A9D4E8P4_DREPO|nr:hypothetical protein DPMN_175100 [Dreissena polymorpha]